MTNIFRFLFGRNKIIDSSNSNEYRQGLEALEKADKYFKNGLDSVALSYYDQAIKFGQKEGFYNRGLCLQALDFNLEAIDDFTEAISITPEDCNLYFCRGSSKVYLKDYEGAIEDGTKAAELAEKGLSFNKKYDEGAKAQGSKSAATLYELFIFTWGAMHNPSIEKILKKRLEQRRLSALPEDIAYVEKSSQEQKNIFKRRNDK